MPMILTKLCGGGTFRLEGYGNKHFLCILYYLSEVLPVVKPVISVLRPPKENRIDGSMHICALSLVSLFTL